jgi:hypothetical protein
MSDAPRVFVILGAADPEEMLDKAERHGPVLRAAMRPSPAGEAAYGAVEIGRREGGS